MAPRYNVAVMFDSTEMSEQTTMSTVQMPEEDNVMKFGKQKAPGYLSKTLHCPMLNGHGQNGMVELS